MLIGEMAGEGRAAPSGQLALRIALLPKYVEMDVSVTRASLGSSPSTWGTVALTFMF